ncbi:MAG: glycosyl hydrolase family 2 [Prevotella sp.]|nr:glycosyl hydrolase family 2 [Prevotella sp.]
MRTYKKVIFSLLLAALGVSSAWSEGTPSWPFISREAKAGTRWWWMGSAVDENNLSWNLSEFAHVGMGTVEIAPIYGVQGNSGNALKFLQTPWMKALQTTQQIAESHNMDVDMTMGTGWPFGGPTVSIDQAAGKLSYVQQNIEGDGTTEQTISISLDEPYTKLNKVMAYPMSGNDGKVTEITSLVSGKNVKWVAPVGKWLVLAIYNGHTLQMVKRAAPGGEGYVLDHFDADAVKAYLQLFEDAFEASGVPYPHCFFNDSYEVYYADWTPRMFEEFEKYRGYKLEEHMHELLGLATDTNNQVLADYRATINDMLINNFTKQWTDWAHSHGVLTRNQAHGSPANLIDVYATVDIPEIEGFGLSEFGIKGLRTDPGFTRSNYSDDATLKYASSAAHITGKKLTSSETFTWLTEHFRTSLSQMKPDLDLMFLSGVNHVLFHGSTYSPQDAAWPGWKFYAAVDMSPTNSFWKDAPELMKYIERCQSFLQMGKPDNDFLVYAPFVNAWHKDKRKGTLFADKLLTFPIDNLSSKMPDVKNAAQQVMKAGYDCDFISDKFLLSARVVDGKIETDGGTRYQGLVIPLTTDMPTDVKNRLEELAGQGANIVYQTNAEALHSMGAKPEPIRTELGLRTIRRSNDTGYHYFISNITNRHVADYVSLSVPFNSLVMFDPMTGAVFTPAINDEGKVYVDLKSGQSVILQTYTTEQVTCDSVYVVKDELAKMTIDGAWTLGFTDDSTPAISKTYDIGKLQTWENLDENTARLMGTGIYTTTFNVSHLQKEAATGGFKLHLGDVRESARVYLNDTYIGCAWCAPFILDCGQLVREGENTLRIEVTNLPANRIRQMDIDNVKWRIFEDVNILDILNGNIGVSGVTSFANWEKMPSGLHSSVSLIPLSVKGKQLETVLSSIHQDEQSDSLYYPVYALNMPDGMAVSEVVAHDGKGNVFSDFSVSRNDDGSASIIVKGIADGGIQLTANARYSAYLPVTGPYRIKKSYCFASPDFPVDDWTRTVVPVSIEGFNDKYQMYNTSKTNVEAFDGLIFSHTGTQSYYVYTGCGMYSMRDDEVTVLGTGNHDIGEWSYVVGSAEGVDYRAADSVTVYKVGDLYFPMLGRDNFTLYRSLTVYEPLYATNPTAIRQSSVSALPSNKDCYTLQGIRIREPRSKGVYIVNGMKVIIH